MGGYGLFCFLALRVGLGSQGDLDSQDRGCPAKSQVVHSDAAIHTGWEERTKGGPRWGLQWSGQADPRANPGNSVPTDVLASTPSRPYVCCGIAQWCRGQKKLCDGMEHTLAEETIAAQNDGPEQGGLLKQPGGG